LTSGRNVIEKTAWATGPSYESKVDPKGLAFFYRIPTGWHLSRKAREVLSSRQSDAYPSQHPSAYGRRVPPNSGKFYRIPLPRARAIRMSRVATMRWMVFRVTFFIRRLAMKAPRKAAAVAVNSKGRFLDWMFWKWWE